MKDRKEEIINATLELAAENGLGTVSMQQIADRVGITKASLYNHFSSVQLSPLKSRKAEAGRTDYDRLTADLSLKGILTGAVRSYMSMVNDPRMLLFYRIIMSERTISGAAAEIMAKETQTMINATQSLFYALQVKGLADFGTVDAAAFSFAMAVHAIIEYQFDLEQAGMKKTGDMMEDFIEEFSRLYSAGKGNDEDGK